MEQGRSTNINADNLKEERPKDKDEKYRGHRIRHSHRHQRHSESDRRRLTGSSSHDVESAIDEGSSQRQHRRHHHHHHHSRSSARIRFDDKKNEAVSEVELKRPLSEENDAVLNMEASQYNVGDASPSKRIKQDNTSGKEAEESEGEWVEMPPFEPDGNDNLTPDKRSPMLPSDLLKAHDDTTRDEWMKQKPGDEFDFGSLAGPAKEKKSVNDKKPTKEPSSLANVIQTTPDYLRASEVPTYTFGDGGSQWRMMKLKRTYEAALSSGLPVDEVAIKRYASLKEFDEAREEEEELSKRELYGQDRKGRVDVPTQRLYKERMDRQETEGAAAPTETELAMDIDQDKVKKEAMSKYGYASDEEEESGNYSLSALNATDDQRANEAMVSQTVLNKLKAQLLKAKLRKDPNVQKLQEEYDRAEAARNSDPTKPVDYSGRSIEVLGLMDTRGITTPKSEEDASLADLVAEEKRTRGVVRGGEGRLMAERISRDQGFSNDLDYIDENSEKLAKRIQRKEINLKSMAIGDIKKMEAALDKCPLCFRDGSAAVAPVLALGTRVYITLPPKPQMSYESATIVPIQHHPNTLDCDEDEWEEIRNFMKCLMQMYHKQGRSVIFYENAANLQRRRHAAIEAVPIPQDLSGDVRAFFQQAILESSEEWSQHRKIIDTQKKSIDSGLGKFAFRSSMVKEMPYFHVWLDLNGGLGHVIEDTDSWPRGDLFARQVIGGLLQLEPDVIRRQGRWDNKTPDARIDTFRKDWTEFDWTKALIES